MSLAGVSNYIQHSSSCFPYLGLSVHPRKQFSLFCLQTDNAAVCITITVSGEVNIQDLLIFNPGKNKQNHKFFRIGYFTQR